MFEDVIKELQEAIRAEYGIKEFDPAKPVKDQVPQGMDKVDVVMFQMLVENSFGADLENVALTGNETMEDIRKILMSQPA